MSNKKIINYINNILPTILKHQSSKVGLLTILVRSILYPYFNHVKKFKRVSKIYKGVKDESALPTIKRLLGLYNLMNTLYSENDSTNDIIDLLRRVTRQEVKRIYVAHYYTVYLKNETLDGYRLFFLKTVGNKNLLSRDLVTAAISTIADRPGSKVPSRPWEDWKEPSQISPKTQYTLFIKRKLQDLRSSSDTRKLVIHCKEIYDYYFKATYGSNIDYSKIPTSSVGYLYTICADYIKATHPNIKIAYIDPKNKNTSSKIHQRTIVLQDNQKIAPKEYFNNSTRMLTHLTPLVKLKTDVADLLLNITVAKFISQSNITDTKLKVNDKATLHPRFITQEIINILHDSLFGYVQKKMQKYTSDLWGIPIGRVTELASTEPVSIIVDDPKIKAKVDIISILE